MTSHRSHTAKPLESSGNFAFHGQTYFVCDGEDTFVAVPGIFRREPEKPYDGVTRHLRELDGCAQWRKAGASRVWPFLTVERAQKFPRGIVTESFESDENRWILIEWIVARIVAPVCPDFQYEVDDFSALVDRYGGPVFRELHEFNQVVCHPTSDYVMVVKPRRELTTKFERGTGTSIRATARPDG